jgi:hypothetical protein
MDVIAHWKMYDGFNGNKTFFTDSNGLEMQERHLNYRATYDILTNTSQNISSNYYPVTSAIAVRDTSPDSTKTVVIMNDRSQGGSAELEQGTIELMQNRRLTTEDGRGIADLK